MKHSLSKGIFLKKMGSKALMTTLCIGLGACSTPGDEKTEKFVYTAGRPVYGIQPGPNVVASLWEGGEYGYVRIVPAESTASGSNTHPIDLSPEQIEQALSGLNIQKGNKDPQPLFTQRELDRLADPLAGALAQAQPDQDIIFAAADREGGVLASIIDPLLMTTGRVFYRNGALNLILGTVEAPFEGQLRATGVMPKLKSGSRDHPAQFQQQILLGPAMTYAASEREDWIQFNARLLSTPSQPIATERAPAPVGPVTTTPPSTPRPIETGPAPRYRDEAFYQQAEIQLKGLKQLREQGLLTEQEYQQKRQAIIDQL